MPDPSVSRSEARRWTVWRVRMGSFAGEWRATECPHSPEALGSHQVEMIEVMPVAEHERLLADRCACHVTCGDASEDAPGQELAVCKGLPR